MGKRVMNILLVDDDEQCLQGYLSVLEPGNYRCTAVSSPVEALELYKRSFLQGKTPFDAVVTDLRMPGMNGISLVSAIKRFDPGARIIIITAFSDRQTIEAVIDFDVYACFGKPIRLRDLMETFEQIERELEMDHDRGEPADE